MTTTRHEWQFACPDCGYLASSLDSPTASEASHRPLDEMARELALAGLRRRNFETILDWLLPRLDASQRSLLDVGCAHGWFLDAALARGFAVQGLESDAAIAAIAARKGHAVVTGEFPEALSTQARFDVIAFNDVFEHLRDPRQAIVACRQQLRPRGVLVLNLPSSRGAVFRIARALDFIGVATPYARLWQKGFPSPHLSYFHPQALARLAASGGFDEIYRDTLPAFERAGLWQRLRYDAHASLAGNAITWVSLRLALPVLHHLPADISVQFFRRRED
jgi:2-polyprenyl-3-methyl-5-hydroxy-6-metoxy-1,4-benzoquinol methylase